MVCDFILYVKDVIKDKIKMSLSKKVFQHKHTQLYTLIYDAKTKRRLNSSIFISV